MPMEQLFGLLFYVPALVLALRAAEPLPQRREVSLRRPPWATIGLLLLVGMPSLAQLAVPEIYTWLHRDSVLIMQHGQWWRPYTSFVVQDGGLAGTAFNLITLAIVGCAAERAWGRATMLGIFFGCLLLFSIDTFLVVQPPGGGNSGVTFRLATSMAGLALVAGPALRSRLLACGIVGIAIALLVLGDPHGEPLITGLAVGLVVALVGQRRARSRNARAPRAQHSSNRGSIA
jgi:membrane associated rhomboid family serine protease